MGFSITTAAGRVAWALILAGPHRSLQDRQPQAEPVAELCYPLPCLRHQPCSSLMDCDHAMFAAAAPPPGELSGLAALDGLQAARAVAPANRAGTARTARADDSACAGHWKC